MSKRQRTLQEALEIFLADYASRSADFEGYLLFGFLVRANLDVTIDLLGPDVTAETPRLAARHLAVTGFARIARTARFRLSQAVLTLKTGAQALEQVVDGVVRHGYEMSFAVDATTSEGARAQAACARFIAPHDPGLERMRLDVEERDT